MQIISILLLFLSTTLMTDQTPSIHNLKIQALDSEEFIDFSQYEGKKILIVNVASKCGFTYQYEGLEELYKTYKEDLVVIGIPCNQFLKQEPGSESDIVQFCSINYGVTFPMATKVDVKGKGQHEVYKWLTDKDLNGKDDYKVAWNFNKFLLDENGALMAYFGSKVKPMDDKITSLIKS